MEKELIRDFKDKGIGKELIPGLLKKELSLWGIKEIAEDYRTLSQIESFEGTETEDRPGGVSPNWSLRVEAGVRIIREERYKVRRELTYRAEKEREAREASREKERAKKGRGR